MKKMKYDDFLRIAEYGNENWKGSFTPEEVIENAQIYHANFLWSKEHNKVSETIKSLCKNLAEDVKAMPDLEQPKQWLLQIETELGKINGTEM